MEPLPIGTEYDGNVIVEVVDMDPSDTYQPFSYLLDNGEIVWIPQGEEPQYIITEQGRNVLRANL